MANLPSNILVSNAVQDRIIEINKMEVCLKNNERTIKKTPLQILPRQMRRRAASHNIKRFPLRFRTFALDMKAKSDFCKTNVTVKKNRKRKRRMKTNLNCLESGRLSTHLWHAKRFHIRKMHGFMVPLRSTDKSGRAVMKSLKRRSVIQDISWWRAYQNVKDVIGSETYSENRGGFVFIHPASKQEIVNGERIFVSRFRIRGNNSRKVIENLIKEKGALRSIRNGMLMHFHIPDPSLFRPARKESLKMIDRREVDMVDNVATVKIEIYANEYRQGTYQSFDIIVHESEEIVNATHKVWLNLVYSGCQAIGEQDAAEISHRLAFRPHYPVDYRVNLKMNIREVFRKNSYHARN